jgi:2-polyprenyl-3-methyl-5-hydroxy-6-metoxy-1,4-benzoquinol methylase
MARSNESTQKVNNKELKIITSEFISSVNKLSSASSVNHVWLRSVGKMVLSLMNLEIIREDMNIFKEYVVKKGIVLDFGCGSGYNSVLLANMGFWVKSVDVNNYTEYRKNEYNKLMAEDQRRLWNELSKKSKRLSFSHYSNTLSFKRNTFDAVLAHAVLEHVPVNKVPTVLAEIHRVLKPKGVLYISRLPRSLSWSEHLARVMRIGCHEKLYGDQEMVKILHKSKFEVFRQEYEEVIPAYPESITNLLYPFLIKLNKFLLHTPIKIFSHHLRLVAKAS